MGIRVLPPDVAARIAAGEVIERPASIVKELVENSLDAGATRVSVEIRAGGVELIRVVDDGCGIAPEELSTAFARHATSKLEDGEDLSRILTLGFRGEALPSIAAVAEVEVVSRPPGEERGAYLRLGPGVETASGVRGAPAGTSITVVRLFERQPARRKFLRSTSSEAGAVAGAVTHYALAYPEVRFALTIDGRAALATQGSGDLRDAASAVYGPDVAAAMLEVAPDDSAPRPIDVRGLVAPPHISRAGRGYVSLFVNRRWVQNRRLVFAVEEAYQGLLMVGRRPIAVLNLRLPYEEVDVNVHPQKAEVRFLDESAAFGALQRAVRRALLEASPVPRALRPGSGEAFAGATPDASPALALSAQPFDAAQDRPTAPLLWRHAVALERRHRSVGAEEPGHLEPDAPLDPYPGPSPDDPVAQPLPRSASSTPAQALPVLRVIGQLGALYIIAEGPDGMYLIDQHAAHERVLYEAFSRRRREARPEVQGLLEPLAVDLTPLQRAALAEEAEGLRGHGFEIEPFGEGAYVLRAAPMALAASDLRQSFARFLDHLLEEGPLPGKGDRVAMSLACHGAVRAGKTLSLEEMRDLVRQLEETVSPNTCPHGRPTMVHMSAEILAREFGRR